MRLYPFCTPALLIRLMPSLTWRKESSDKKTIYLTFDDGPDPEATPYVLNLLDKYEAKATFFVVGANAEQHPEVLQLTYSKGHAIGNHTHHHLSGWRTATETYLKDVATCKNALYQALERSPSKLFRPPYGRITPGQLRSLKNEFEIVMWSLLSGDFDENLNLEAAKRALRQSQSGEVIVFHDSQKSLPNLRQLLPWYLDWFHHKGYKFAALSPQK